MLIAPDPARGVKFSFAPSLTLDGDRVFATVFYDVFDGQRWAGFDADVVPLKQGALAGAPIPASGFVRRSIADHMPEFALSSRFPASTPAAYRDGTGHGWLMLLQTFVPMGVPDSAKLLVLHPVDITP